MARIDSADTSASAHTIPSNAPKNRSRKQRPLLLTIYLFLYNAYSALAWLYPLLIITLHLSGLTRARVMAKSPTLIKNWVAGGLLPIQLAYGPANTIRSYPWAPEWLAKMLTRSETTYTIVGEAVKWIQTAAILEIIHSSLGWVRSPVMTTVMQVASRITLVWGIADQYPSTHTNPIYTSMVLAWSLTEVIRYAFYACNVLGFEPYSLLWLRYTTFYVLYPLGAGSEAFLMFSTLPISPTFPPSYNFSVWTASDYVRGTLYLIWWPGLYFMYTYMITQRRKVLGRAGKPKSKAAKAE